MREILAGDSSAAESHSIVFCVTNTALYVLRREKFSSAEDVADGDVLSKYNKAAVDGFAAAQFALTFFEFTPMGKLTILYSFCQGNCADGSHPIGPVARAANGRFYISSRYPIRATRFQRGLAVILRSAQGVPTNGTIDMAFNVALDFNTLTPSQCSATRTTSGSKVS
jgi:hypothetical protein